MSPFKWTEKRTKAAIALAEGRFIKEAAKIAGVDPRTVKRWKSDIDFSAEVDRLSVMVDVSSRAGRMRIAMQAVRQMVSDERIETEKDLLDWLKFAQSETQGVKLDLAKSLAAILDDGSSVAGSGSDGASGKESTDNS